ncbi:MAG: protein-ADP-ribose hydrolase [Bacteroides sp.]|nr:protein-ADP-ribose hydrolase [Bacteroides sp.]
MERKERLHYLLNTLLSEKPEYASIRLPEGVDEQALLLRSLMNVREPNDINPEFLRLQDEELSFQREGKGIVKADDFGGSPADPRLCLWQGDITRLEVDCIVNAANSQMLGCFIPLHGCIDNAIHSAAGIQVRLECYAQMQKFGREAHTAEVISARGYNLPARRILHVTGPIVTNADGPTDRQRKELQACYANCLVEAENEKLESIAFCCISTGVFRFPNAEAATIAVDTVRAYFQQHLQSGIRKVVFNVFKDEDLHIYRRLLGYGL